ncbi:unnamed protein product [Closterium sp. NIES-53]
MLTLHAALTPHALMRARTPPCPSPPGALQAASMAPVRALAARSSNQQFLTAFSSLHRAPASTPTRHPPGDASPGSAQPQHSYASRLLSTPPTHTQSPTPPPLSASAAAPPSSQPAPLPLTSPTHSPSTSSPPLSPPSAPSPAQPPVPHHSHSQPPAKTSKGRTRPPKKSVEDGGESGKKPAKRQSPPKERQTHKHASPPPPHKSKSKHKHHHAHPPAPPPATEPAPSPAVLVDGASAASPDDAALLPPLPPTPPLILPPPPPDSRHCRECPLGTAVKPASGPTDVACVCAVPMVVGLRLALPFDDFLHSVPLFAQQLSAGLRVTPQQVQVWGVEYDRQGTGFLDTTSYLLPLHGTQLPASLVASIRRRLLGGHVWLDPALFGRFQVLFILNPGDHLPPPALHPASAPSPPPPPWPASSDGWAPPQAGGGTEGGGGSTGHSMAALEIALFIVAPCLLLLLMLASCLAWLLLYRRRQHRSAAVADAATAAAAAAAAGAPMAADVVDKDAGLPVEKGLESIAPSQAWPSSAAFCSPSPDAHAALPSSSLPSEVAGLGVSLGFAGTGTGLNASSLALCGLATAPAGAVVFSLLQLRRATNDFHADNLLGQGGFSRVYRGELADDTLVAVKLLHSPEAHGDAGEGGAGSVEEQERERADAEFMREAQVLSCLHHRNLVKLLGICAEGGRRCLVYQLAGNGSLASHLHGVMREVAGVMEWERRMKVALGVARALSYLHDDASPRVVHRDVKSANVLLDLDFSPLLSDLGLAKTMPHAATPALAEQGAVGGGGQASRMMGSVGYVAPEVALTGQVLVRSDVYSFGVVLLELLAGRKPIDHSLPPPRHSLVQWASPLLLSSAGVKQVVDPALKGRYPLEAAMRVAGITSMCLQQLPDNRPFMTQVVQALKLVYREGSEDSESDDNDDDESFAQPSHASHRTPAPASAAATSAANAGIGSESGRVSESDVTSMGMDSGMDTSDSAMGSTGMALSPSDRGLMPRLLCMHVHDLDYSGDMGLLSQGEGEPSATCMLRYTRILRAAHLPIGSPRHDNCEVVAAHPKGSPRVSIGSSRLLARFGAQARHGRQWEPTLASLSPAHIAGRRPTRADLIASRPARHTCLHAMAAGRSWTHCRLAGLVLLAVCCHVHRAVALAPLGRAEQSEMRETARTMFYHAYDNYMRYAFPHDELKPLSRSYTNSLGELGNLQMQHLSTNYNGSALTLIDSLSSLAVLGNVSEFQWAVRWLASSLSFHADVRVNTFECNIRLLGGLLSGHLLAQHHSLLLHPPPPPTSPSSRGTADRREGAEGEMEKEHGARRGREEGAGAEGQGTGAAAGDELEGERRSMDEEGEGVRAGVEAGGNEEEGETGAWYRGELLVLAEQLGRRLMPAFNTPTGIPYAWINLKYGVRAGETTETSTSGCGSLILEFGLLSRLTGDPCFERAAQGALRRVWGMRSAVDLVGTTLDVASGQWVEGNTGIGAGVDSFYEYLLKAYVLFGDPDYWHMFQAAYTATQRYLRTPHPSSWYHDAHMHTGSPTYRQFASLQAFWPALQVLAGDVAAANATHRQFFTVWEKFGLLPERYLFDMGVPHPTERYYPLRPELAESTFALYHATKDPWYQRVGQTMLRDLNRRTRVAGGYASVRDVTTGELEDHQHSFFLAETCKYLYLLFDESALERGNIHNYIFSTEGHILPVLPQWHHSPPDHQTSPEGQTSGVSSRKGGCSGGCRANGHVGSTTEQRGASAMDRMVCHNFQYDWSRSSQQQQQQQQQREESICHVPDIRPDHRCLQDIDCGIHAATCSLRTCSPARYCS